MALETLHCEEGDHSWERERKRGRKPANCPDHTTEREIADREAHMRKMQEGRDAAAAERRKTMIREWKRDAREKGCRCKVTPTMTLTEINSLEGGCTDLREGGPGWVCPSLDKLRRMMGH